MRSVFIFLLFLGLIIRILLIGNTGFIADISFWKSWSMAAADYGITWTTHNTNINYPPGFIYVLWLMGKIYTLFGNPHDFNAYWRENNFAFLFVSKSFAVVSDMIIACLIYWFVSQKEKLKQLGSTFDLNMGGTRRGAPKSSVGNIVTRDLGETGDRTHKLKYCLPLILSMIFYFNPAVILDSALWGQVESFGILFTVIAILFIFYRKPLLGIVFFTTGVYMKLQNIIYIPLIFLFIARYFDLKTVVKAMGIFVLTTFIIILPFIIHKDTDRVLYLMTVNGDYFPYLSLNAHNPWWIAARGEGMKVNDKIAVFLTTNAKTFGLIIFSGAYLLSTLLLWLKPRPKNLLLALAAGIFAFFLFTTQSHERYSYPMLVFLLLFYPFLKRGFDHTDNSKIKNQNAKLQFKIQNFISSKFHLYFWIVYALLTLSIFFNIHMGLVLNYPQNGFPLFTQLSTKTIGILNSYLMTFLYFLLLPFVFLEVNFLYAFLPIFLILSGLTAANFSYLTGGKVSLTKYTPVIAKQDYGSLQKNMTVNSHGGWKTWNRLSNNYFYYRTGFGTHANSNHVFDIGGKFSRFTTDVGIDTEAGTPATAVFEIWGDGKKLYSSPKMGRFEFPAHAEVDIKGIRFLGLVVQDGGDGINSDHAGWYNPILYR